MDIPRIRLMTTFSMQHTKILPKNNFEVYYLKETSFTRLILIICLLIWTGRYQVFSQTKLVSPSNQRELLIDLTSKGIKIGEFIPDISVDVNNYSSESVKPSDFKGKVLIIDFWATWCSPCVATLPIMDSLQRVYHDKIQFLSVTYQQDSEAIPFLKKLERKIGRKLTFPMVTGDTDLKKLFPHRTIPHYVWIDEHGIVKAITGHDAINEHHIKQAIDNRYETMPRKGDFFVTYTHDHPLLINGNGGSGREMVYHSVLTRYVEGMPSTYTIKSIPGFQGARFTCTNTSIRNLFAYAYGAGQQLFSRRRISILSKDSLLLSSAHSDDKIDWIRSNGYSYELLVAEEEKDSLFAIARSELHRLFPQYQVSIEVQSRPCMALVATGDLNLLKSKGKEILADFNPFGFVLNNFYLGRIVGQLNAVYMQHSPYWIVDETNFSEPVDLKIQANLSDFTALNKALKPHGLQFIEKIIDVEILVIRDIKK